MRYTIVALSSLFTAISALTITSPTGGSTVDPSQPITVRWTSTGSDPATFNLVLSSPNAGVSVLGSTTSNRLASNVQTSTGSYTVPANAISGYGTDFTVSALSAAGDNLASSPSFVLGYGSNQVVTLGNGQLSLVPTAAASSSFSSLVFDTSGLEGQSVTATYLPSTDVSVTVTATSTGIRTSGILPSVPSSTHSVTGSMTIMSSGSSTSVRSSSSSTGGSSSASSAGPASSNNAQPRVGAGKEVMGLAGLLAGLVALAA